MVKISLKAPHSMLILALDTSGKAGSTALFDDSTLLKSRPIGDTSTQRRASASNFSADVAQLLLDSSLTIDQLDVIAVTVGPGSFTGLRVGVVAAKTMAYALDCKTIGVNALSAIAAAAIEEAEVSSVCTVMDAQRSQLFACRFEADSTWNPRTVGEVEIIDKTDLTEFAGAMPIAGPGLTKLSTNLANLNALERRYWSCNAEWVGQHSYPRVASGSFDDLWGLKPKYYRASAAEEKRQSQLD